MYLPGLSPYAFYIGPIGIHWYSIFMAFALVVGALWALHESRKLGVDTDRLLDTVIWVVVAGIVGARLVFVLANKPLWIIHAPLKALAIYQGGLSIHGAILGGVIMASLYLKRHLLGLNFNQFMDLTVVGICVGYIFVRVGNIFNHEVLGRVTELGFGRWPAQLVGSAIGVTLLIRYAVLYRKRVPAGYQFWSFVFYYQLLRGLIEELVRQNPLYLIHYIVPVWGLGFTTLTQLFTLPIMAFAYIMMRRSVQAAQSHHLGQAVS